MAVCYACANHTVSVNEITLPEDFETFDLGIDGWEKIVTSVNSSHMADDHRATSQDSGSADPLFSPEQQAWIELLIRDCTSHSLSKHGSTSSPAVTAAPSHTHRPVQAMWVSSLLFL